MEPNNSSTICQWASIVREFIPVISTLVSVGVGVGLSIIKDYILERKKDKKDKKVKLQELIAVLSKFKTWVPYLVDKTYKNEEPNIEIDYMADVRSIILTNFPSLIKDMIVLDNNFTWFQSQILLTKSHILEKSFPANQEQFQEKVSQLLDSLFKLNHRMTTEGLANKNLISKINHNIIKLKYYIKSKFKGEPKQ